MFSAETHIGLPIANLIIEVEIKMEIQKKYKFKLFNKPSIILTLVISISNLTTAWSQIIDSCTPSSNECQLPAPAPGKRHLFFLFAGHNEFSTASYAAWQRMQASGLDCSHSRAGYARLLAPRAGSHEGSQEVSQEVSIDSLQMAIYNERNPTGSPNALNGFILESLCRYGHADFSDMHLFYFDEEEGRDQAIACARAYSSPNRTLSVFGFSHGGQEALRFAQDLLDNHINVTMGATVDPVPKTMTQNLQLALSFLALEQYGTSHSLSAPAGIPWVNFWQTSDNRWGRFARGTYGLHGVGVSGAQPNLLVTPVVDPNHREPNGGHFRILREPSVAQGIADAARERHAIGR